MTDLVAIVPALDEASTISQVIADIRLNLTNDVVVIDDGSSDSTAELALASGAVVLPMPFNAGVGTAVRAGIRFAADRGYSRLVQMDADGQHSATEAKLLLDAMERNDFDLIVGSRFNAGYSTGRARKRMMRVLARMVSRRIGVRITDSTSGFRAMGPKAISLFAEHYPDEYLSDTVEALLLAHRRGLLIGEVDVKMEARQGGTPSASALHSTYHLLRLMLVLLLERGRTDP